MDRRVIDRVKHQLLNENPNVVYARALNNDDDIELRNRKQLYNMKWYQKVQAKSREGKAISNKLADQLAAAETYLAANSSHVQFKTTRKNHTPVLGLYSPYVKAELTNIASEAFGQELIMGNV